MCETEVSVMNAGESWRYSVVYTSQAPSGDGGRKVKL